jgi:cell division protein FtsL
MINHELRCFTFLLQSYEKTIQEIQKQLDDLDKKISTQTKENQRLDTEVTNLNIDVNEQQLLRDFEFESRQTEAAKRR